MSDLTPIEMEQLQQLLRVTWDGDVLSKMARDRVVILGYAERYEGLQFINRNGLEYLAKWGFLPDMSTHWRKKNDRVSWAAIKDALKDSNLLARGHYEDGEFLVDQVVADAISMQEPPKP